MARGKHKSKLIQVKSAPKDTNAVVNLLDLSTGRNSTVLKPKDIQKLKEMITDDLVGKDSLATKRETAKDYVTTMEQISPRQENVINNFEDAFIEVQLKMEGEANNVDEVLNPELMIVGKKIEEDKSEVVTTKKTKKDEKKKKDGQKKKKRDKKKKNEATLTTENIDDKINDAKPIRLEPITRKNKHVQHDNTAAPSPTLKPVSCFGFVSTWIAKRKEKRREKKKKAIKARNNAPVETLVEYEHKRAKGGVAFTVEVDNRPIAKSVLPPIKQKPGPIRLATEQKLVNADNKRTEQINKKKENARAHSRLVREVADRRAQKESDFKQATLQKIKNKEYQAERATSRVGYARNQRCASGMKSRLDILTAKWESAVATPVEVISPVPSEEDPFSFWGIESDPHYNEY